MASNLKVFLEVWAEAGARNKGWKKASTKETIKTEECIGQEAEERMWVEDLWVPLEIAYSSWVSRAFP